MKRILLFVLFALIPLPALAKSWILPSGAKVFVEEPKYLWVEKFFVLPNGYLFKDLIKVAKAKELDVWENYYPLKRACSCESWWSPNGEPRQFNNDGSILWGQDRQGKIIKRDVGACQINTEIHSKKIKELKLDVINSKQDNVTFAKFLYDENGLKPWEPSRVCWK